MNYADIFNKELRGESINISLLIQMIEEYLTDNKKDTSVLNVIAENPQLIQLIYPQIKEYIIKKYSICYIIYNNQIITYVENI